MKYTLVIIIGLMMFLIGQTIQAFSISALIGVVSRWFKSERNLREEGNLLGGFTILSITLLALLLNSLFQVGLWAVVFMLVGQFDSYHDAFYHSAVNFSTLGYGDLVMDFPWNMLGALEAISGVLMLGLSTATLSAVFGKLFELRRRSRDRRKR